MVMKPNFLIFFAFCLFFSQNSKAQLTFSMGDTCNHWYVYDLKDSIGGSDCNDYPSDTIHYYIGGDTVFAGFTWKKFMQEDSGYIGGIRSEGSNDHIVYFFHRDSTTQRTLYNFSDCGFGFQCKMDTFYEIDTTSWVYHQNNGIFNFDTWCDWQPCPNIDAGAGIFVSMVLLSNDTLNSLNAIHVWVLGVGSVPGKIIWPNPPTITRSYSGPLIPMYHDAFWQGTRPQHLRQRLWKFVHCGIDSLEFDINGNMLHFVTNENALNLPTISFSPNPATNISCTDFPNHFGLNDKYVCLKLFNHTGVTLRSEFVPIDSKTICIEKQNLTSGIYFYRIETENGGILCGKVVFTD